MHLAAGRIQKNGRRLANMGEWAECTRLVQRGHWKDGRSAKETARAWLEAVPYMQRDIARLLANCPGIGTISGWSAEPEARVAIDRFPGEPPNVDLLLVADDDQGSLVIAIEAKADECFGKPLAEQYEAARRRALDLNSRSNAVARIDALCALFAIEPERDQVLRLRYQLLTGTAAALAEAERRRADRAVFIVHEFLTPLTVPEKRERNAEDLRRFLATALRHRVRIAPGEITGPISVPGAPLLHVGKARTVV